jgi:cytochrome c oxidase cbb3-type subunit 1
MFGAAYFYLPRVTGKSWRSAVLIRVHYAATALGIVALVLGLSWAGWEQGRLLNDAGVAFPAITEAISPWLAFRSVVLILLTIGHAAFLINFVWIACPVNSRDTAAAVIQDPPAMEVAKA